MTVVKVDTRRLGSADFCFNERPGDGSWCTYAEAWTTHPLEEVLREEHRTYFLAPMTHFAKPGDTLEIFRVTEITKPEADPLEMAMVTVTHFTTDRDGERMHTWLDPTVLRFGSAMGSGVEERLWRGRQCVFQDGKRVGSFNTLVEAVECAERLRSSERGTFAKRVNAHLAELRKVVPITVTLPAAHRCRREDIAYGLPKKISRELTVRVLDPIPDVLADPQYFSRVVSCFRTADRVTLMRFDNDTFAHRIVEMLRLAIADVSANRLRLYPQFHISKPGHEPEKGWVRETIRGRVHLRENGRTKETFANDERCDWFCVGKGIQAMDINPKRAA